MRVQVQSGANMDPSREGGQRTHDLVYEDVGAVERDCPVCATEDPAERLPKRYFKVLRHRARRPSAGLNPKQAALRAVERDCPVCATEDPAERLPKAVPQAEFKSFH